MTSLDDALDRLRAMTDPKQQTWDLSPNDIESIRLVIAEGATFEERKATMQAACQRMQEALEIEYAKGIELRQEVQRLAAELADAQRRIELAGGYHERTEREVEIEAALGDLEYDERNPEDHAIAYLLELVDAGRNRVHTVEEANQRLAAVVEACNIAVDKWQTGDLSPDYAMVAVREVVNPVRAAEQAGGEM